VVDALSSVPVEQELFQVLLCSRERRSSSCGVGAADRQTALTIRSSACACPHARCQEVPHAPEQTQRILLCAHYKNVMFLTLNRCSLTLGSRLGLLSFSLTVAVLIRFLLIVLMFALPSQFVWAATAGYCTHESSPASFHVGHHAHVHQASTSDDIEHADADSTKLPKSVVTQAHTDCSYCQALVAPLASTQPSSVGPPPVHVFTAATTPFTSIGAEESIYRPKWTRAA
jgi:hypothetical protein